MTMIELRACETICASLPRIAAALGRIADVMEKASEDTFAEKDVPKSNAAESPAKPETPAADWRDDLSVRVPVR